MADSPAHDSQYEVSVVLSLEEHRGRALVSIASWAREQTLPRSRYEIIVVGNGGAPDVERQVTALLAPHDLFVECPSVNDFELFSAGARRATGRILFFTESHAVGAPACLERMIAYLDASNHVGARCHCVGINESYAGELEARLYAKLQVQRAAAGEGWMEERGFAIYRSVFEEQGGFEDQYSIFEERAFGVRLRLQDLTLGYAREAVVHHFNQTRILGFFGPARHYVYGDCLYRATHPKAYCDAHFGRVVELEQRDAYRSDVARWRLRALMRRAPAFVGSSRRATRVYVASLLGLASRATLGLTPIVWAYRARALSSALRVATWRWINMEKALDAFQQYWHRDIVRYYRFEYLASASADSNPRLNGEPALTYPIGDGDAAGLAGFHEAEVWQSKPFRWSQPVAAVRVNVPPGDYVVDLEILPVVPDSEHVDIGLALNQVDLVELPERRSAKRRSFRLPWTAFAGGDPERFLIIASPPFAIAGRDQPDRRDLCLPIASVSFVPDGGPVHLARRCLVNLAELDPPVNGGQNVYARLLCRWLQDAADDLDLDVVFLVNQRFLPHFDAWLERPGATTVPYHADRRVPAVWRLLDPDVVISPLSGSEPLAELTAGRSIPHIAALPDALALDRPDLIPDDARAWHRAAHASLRQCNWVITGSQHARTRLLHHLGLRPDRVLVAPWHMPLAEDALMRPADPAPSPIRPYLFYPANDWPHKRHALLFEIFEIVARAKPDMRLVLTGHRSTDHFYRCAAERPDLFSRIDHLGYVPASAMAALYSGAEALVFPSSYEGFGMPLIEAMVYGCPVVAAGLTAIPEVVGDAALLVDGDDPGVWAEALLTSLPRQREQLIARGHARAAALTPAGTFDPWRHVLSSVARSARARTVAGAWPLDLTKAASELDFLAEKYAGQQTALEEKEAVIAAMAQQIGIWQADLIAKESVIQDLVKRVSVHDETRSS